eukprot:gnl/Hemi2/28507_TR9439_c0_g1_i1.p1 gnl/Hemi2/28507_TR9439_c0_g1~~gnl/Hemi2/28507_TR9439_c0_g1_i1.p1  ORF type:complete len:349 (-),score=91.45 gnl/Hemi2/28507_TR9439_c0_g1_i1:5-1051(-)
MCDFKQREFVTEPVRFTGLTDWHEKKGGGGGTRAARLLVRLQVACASPAEESESTRRQGKRAPVRVRIRAVKDRLKERIFSNPGKVGQISWESVPGETALGHSPHHAYLLSAPFEARDFFHRAVFDALFPEGCDLLATLLGLETLGTAHMIGAFKGKTNPGTQVLVAMPTERRGRDIIIAPDTQARIDAYIAVLGHVLKQDAMAYHLPLPTSDPLQANGVELDLGRMLGLDEMQALYDALIRLTDSDHHPPVATPTGARVLNFTPGYDNQLFYEHVLQAAAESLSDAYMEARRFKALGNYVENDWKALPDGSNYRRCMEAVACPSLQEVYDRFKKKEKKKKKKKKTLR